MCTGGLALMVKLMGKDMDLACAQAAHAFLLANWVRELVNDRQPDTVVKYLACMGGARVCSRFFLPLFQSGEEHLAAVGKFHLALKPHLIEHICACSAMLFTLHSINVV